MGFTALVETDVGDRFRVLRADGRLGGNALLSFELGLSEYCSAKVPEEVQQWFSTLEELSSRNQICSLAQLLIQASYSGDWDYSDDEYSWFARRSPQMALTEEEFKKTLQQVRQKWTEAKPLVVSLAELERLLREERLDATWWYQPGETDADLRALSHTLLLAIERTAEKVRIKFT